MKLTTMAAAAALCLTAGASFAQPAPPAAAGPQGERHWQKPDPAQMAQHHAQHLRDLLQLRPDQEGALQQLIAAFQPSAGAMAHKPGDREAMHGLPMPERLDRMQAEMAERQARFAKQADAIKRFYAQLTPAQQKAFDTMPMMMDHDRAPHGMRGGPAMMRHGPGGPGGPGAAPPPGE